MAYREITESERAALQRFADREHNQANGHRGARLSWKDALSQVYWYNARIWEGGEPGDGSALHGLRNDLGPTWLYDVCDVRPAPAFRAQTVWETSAAQCDLIGASVQLPGGGLGEIIAFRRTNHGPQAKVRPLSVGEGEAVHFLRALRRTT
jgi:hypothetical protein